MTAPNPFLPKNLTDEIEPDTAETPKDPTNLRLAALEEALEELKDHVYGKNVRPVTDEMVEHWENPGK